MKMNQTLYKLITHYESLHDGDLKQIGLQPKMDPVGIWTEGWGHAIVDSKGNFVKGAANKALAYKLAKVKTVEEADKLFEIDIKPFIFAVHKKITVPLNEAQEAAIVSHFYNTGGSSTLANLINTNSKDLYNWWTTHYIQGGGKVLKGLVYRRKTEAVLFTTGKLEFYN